MNNTLVVKNADGNELTINVIDIVEETTNNKQYICYTIGDMPDVLISNLVENDESYTLEKVTEEERAAVEAILSEDASEASDAVEES